MIRAKNGNKKNRLMLLCLMKTGVTQSRNPTLGAASDPRKLTHHPAPLRLLLLLVKKLPNRLFLCQFHRPLARSIWHSPPAYGMNANAADLRQKVRKMCASRTNSTLRLLHDDDGDAAKWKEKILHRWVKSKHCDVTLFWKPTVSEFCNWRTRIF